MLFCIMRAKFSLMGDSHECSFSRELMIVELPQIIVDALWSSGVEVLTPQGASPVPQLSTVSSNYTRTFHLLGHEGKETWWQTHQLDRQAGSMHASQLWSAIANNIIDGRDMFIISLHLRSFQIPIWTNKLPIFRWPCIVLYILKVASWRALSWLLIHVL